LKNTLRELIQEVLRDAYREEWWWLDDLEPIRNAIMHCRGQYLAEERISRLKESCFELQKLVQKVKS